MRRAAGGTLLGVRLVDGLPGEAVETFFLGGGGGVDGSAGA